MEYNYVKDKWFDKLGVETRFFDGVETMHYFPAILQPLRYKNKMYLSGSRTEIGFEARKQFLLICPAEITLGGYRNTEAMVIFDGYRYIVDRAESVYVGNKVAYNWAIVHKGVRHYE